ncbi:MAG: HEAT repeat domain-containing protein [Oligoflexia bacterium]|nr:HEAT repeat domain-containing protein [Oligoflexia bacterium]
MRRLIFISVLTVAFFGASGRTVSAAMSEQQIHDAVENVLAQIHPTDTPAWWRSLGPQAPKVMISMYDQESFVYHRLRLVQALAWFDDPSGTAFLEKQASETTDDVIRNGAIQSLGTSQGAREDDFIAGFLTNDNPQTRLVAAEALRKAGDAKAQDELTRFLANEKIQWVKDKFKTGALAPAPLRIVPAASSAARKNTISLDFAGKWRGEILVPAFTSDRGMQHYPAALDLSFETDPSTGEKSLHGKFSVGTKAEASFERASGDAGHFRAETPWANFKTLASGRAGDAPSMLSLEAELLPEQAGSNAARVRTLRMAVPGLPAVLLLRRDP